MIRSSNRDAYTVMHIGRGYPRPTREGYTACSECLEDADGFTKITQLVMAKYSSDEPL